MQRIVYFDAEQNQCLGSFVRIQHGLDLKLPRAKNDLLPGVHTAHIADNHLVRGLRNELMRGKLVRAVEREEELIAVTTFSWDSRTSWLP